MIRVYDPGSFKDPDGKVFYHRGQVYRELAPAALTRIQTYFRNGLFKELIERGLVVPSAILPQDSAELEGLGCQRRSKIGPKGGVNLGNYIE